MSTRCKHMSGLLLQEATKRSIALRDDRLLQPERIGVELSEEMQLHPEQSTDASVIHHPAARYFSV